jgi:4,5:9,10-diseco-3-hydroxy-5,9,17-trioxoandrosta-1(10),2-diene-4-oate hydrolase
LQHKLRDSRLLVLPGVGHIPFEEMPDICNQAMRDWLLAPALSEGRHPVASAHRARPVDRAHAPEVSGAA